MTPLTNDSSNEGLDRLGNDGCRRCRHPGRLGRELLEGLNSSDV